MTDSRGPARGLPLVSLEAASILTDRRAEPHTIELTLGFARSVDPKVLEVGLSKAVNRHPMAAVRLRSARPWERRLYWNFTGGEQAVSVANSAERSVGDLVSVKPNMVSEPPFHGSINPDNSQFVLVVNHAAFDGIGAVRFVRTALEAAAGHTAAEPPVDELAARSLAEPGRARHSGSQRRVGRPEHVRGDGGGAAGFLVVHRTVATKKVAGVTMNDLVVAAFHQTLAQWIARTSDTVGAIVTLVPISVRPPAWGRDVVGNHAWIASIVSESDDRRDPARLLREVSVQMVAAKQNPPTPGVYAMLGGGFVPAPVARLGFALAARLGRATIATALVSNLGEIAPLPDVDGVPVEHLWFSPPSREPRPISLGVVGYRGQLHLSFRFRRSTFNETHAEMFADAYVAELGG